jgi:hypothetical protein
MRRSVFSDALRPISPRRLRRMPLVLGAVVALVLGLGAGTAFAYFTSTGHGSGAASTGTPLSVTVLQASGTVTNKLYPGGSGDLRVKLDNPNSYPVTIVAIAAGSGTVTSSGGVGACTNTGVSVSPQSGLNIPVASDASPPTYPVSVIIPGGVSMSTNSDSGCQSATFQVPITITVQKG